MADHSEVKAAVYAITKECPFLWVDESNTSKLDSSTNADNDYGAWQVLENDRRIGDSPLRSWDDLSKEERAKVIRIARQRLEDDHDSDNYQGVHMLMFALGAYDGVSRPSLVDDEHWVPMVSHFNVYSKQLTDLWIEYEKFDVSDGELSAGWTKLMGEAELGNADEITKLISEGHNANAETKEKYVPVTGNNGVRYKQDTAGRTLTPLLIAVRCGHAANVDALIKGGADVNKKDSGGFSPLWYAVESSSSISDGEQLKMTQSLVKAGADLGFKNPENGITLLMQAAKSGKADLTLYLLQQDACKASINDVDNQKHNALFYAVQSYGSSDKGVEVVKAMLAANAKIQQDTIDFINTLPENSEVRKLVSDAYIRQEKLPALLEAVKNGDVASMNNLLTEDLASLSIDEFPLGADRTGSLLDYALDHTQAGKKQAVVEALLARAGEDPTKPPQVTDEILAKAEQQASGGNAEAIAVRDMIRDRYNAQHPVAENALEVALTANAGLGDMSGARRAISADLNGNQLNTLTKPLMAQAYFHMSHEFYKKTNRDLSKIFDALEKCQKEVDQATDPQVKAEKQVELQEKLNELKTSAALYNALTPEEQKALNFIIEQTKPKDKALELRLAIAAALHRGETTKLIDVLGASDEETLKLLVNEPQLASDCFEALGKHYKGMAGDAEKEVGKKYSKLASLYKKLPNETDETKKGKTQAEIAKILQELSVTQASISDGEKKAITILHASVKGKEPVKGPDKDVHIGGSGGHTGGPGVTGGPGATGLPPVEPQSVNPVQMGEAMAAAKADEKTPWYKQEWLWWVLAIAAASALGFFAFRKGGWLNKDDDKSNTNTNTNTNTNDNSNTNTNTNDNSTNNSNSGGTLGNSGECISAGDVNNLLASGGRVPTNDGR